MRLTKIAILLSVLLLTYAAATAGRKAVEQPANNAASGTAHMNMFWTAGNPEVDIDTSNAAKCKVWQPVVHVSKAGYVLFVPDKDIWVTFNRSGVLVDGGDADHPGRTQIKYNNGQGTKVQVDPSSTADDDHPDYTQFVIDGCTNHPGPPIKPSGIKAATLKKKPNIKIPFSTGSDPNEVIVP